MSNIPQNNAIELQQQAEQAALFLRTIGNKHRLTVLCLLSVHGAMSVNTLLQNIPLSQSALSQHLAKLRSAGLIDFQRDAQTLYYAICHEQTEKIINVLKDIFCTPNSKGTPI